MKTIGWLMMLVLAAGAAGVGGYWYGQKHAGAEEKAEATTQPAEEEKPVVKVETAPLKKGTIRETAVAYGVVVAQAGDVRAVSVPFESRVVRVLVTPGESVAAGAEVVRVEASPDALVGLQEAGNAVEAAERDLTQVEQRFKERLATNQDLSAAQQVAASARLKLESLTKRGVGESHTLKAEMAGVVQKVDVQEGQVVAAGGPLVELAAGNRIEVRLWVEPGDAGALKVGQVIRLHRADRDGKAIEGKVRLVEQRVDPATRLVGVVVGLPEGTTLMLESYVTGEIVREEAEGWVVPRDAALPDEEGKFVLYTIKEGKAVKHGVKVGVQDEKSVQVIGEDLKEGDPIVVVGNNLLTDGMQAEEREGAATTEPSGATRPTTGEAGEKP